MAEEKLVSVRNRNNGSTGYTLAERGVYRLWNATGEVKKIPLDELKALQWAPGGQYILENLLVVESDEALDSLNMEVEPEYKYTEEDIKKILLGTTQESLDQLEDFLNFSPEGGLEIAKNLAVSLEIPDLRKREMISKKMNFNINNAIEINHMASEDDGTKEEVEAKKVRKAAPIVSDSTKPVRKVATVSTK